MNKKRKQIDLLPETIRQLRLQAIDMDMSLKAYMEHVLTLHASR